VTVADSAGRAVTHVLPLLIQPRALPAGVSIPVLPLPLLLLLAGLVGLIGVRRFGVQ